MWTRAITEGLGQVSSRGMPISYSCGHGYPAVISDLYLCGQYRNIDGPGRVLGSAGPLFIRRSTGLPITGRMTFDTSDVEQLRATGRLDEVITHEMGHVLGIGTLWSYLGVTGSDAQNCPYLGANANAIWQKESECSGALPTELDGGGGTRCGHFDEACFQNEIMTGYLSFDQENPFSRLTLASMQDMGYKIDLSMGTDVPINPSCSCKRRNLRGEEDGNIFTMHGDARTKCRMR